MRNSARNLSAYRSLARKSQGAVIKGGIKRSRQNEERRFEFTRLPNRDTKEEKKNKKEKV